ncbi:MAG: DUF5615 family PIN-like protein [Phycisphaerae bacterium]|nr:MAG: hypothetical protein EDS66_09180 [Planctomycetota bacterium]KAB2947416.1 MAG: hypothetical protein F9K17_07365 [Phycisphaerae bacterium]MBE7456349.1 DUF5615 family PIN-like protein [Planctomycetia bacterium]MCK6465679.1 DUF5615 family PIN-like protein [Phycisphaerae bacterium]MCL4718467.1 DUF5615 family PIN-like protein [Phycisphaerae bacterium]
MRFIVDQPVSRKIARILRDAGHDAVHAAELGLATAADEGILDHASRDDRIIITQDADFGTLLAFSNRQYPSVILFRMTNGDPLVQGEILMSILDTVRPSLDAGAIVVIGDRMVRLRRLPIRKPRK